MRGRILSVTLAGLVGILGAVGVASAKPIFMPTVVKEIKEQRAAAGHQGGITPPAPPCPENGLFYPAPVSPPSGVPYPIGNCGVGQPPATTVPWLGNMAYYGGHVQVHPKQYLVLWGWGAQGAFPGRSCKSETVTERSVTARLACDPDGAGRYMADFVQQMGGTHWAKVSTQFYQTDSRGMKQYISNDKHVLAGIWVDDTNDIRPLAKTNSGNPPGPTNTYWDLASEALRAAAHFGVRGSDLTNANFIIAQPPAYSDPNALNSGYCAFHDYTHPGVPGNTYYKGLKTPAGLPAPPVAYTNMPYSLAINVPWLLTSNGQIASGKENVCGQNAVNSDARGKLDGFSIVLGHEIEETITDPGAEAVVNNAQGSQRYYGGWYGATDPNENGDKCAWVGEPINNSAGVQNPPGAPSLLPVYGALGNITGNAGSRFAVQSLWSNAENKGTGYCAGAGTDSPLPAEPYGNTSGTRAPVRPSHGHRAGRGG